MVVPHQCQLFGQGIVTSEHTRDPGRLELSDLVAPHGGIGQSGIGHDCSALALRDYLIEKRITRARDDTDFEGLNA